MMPVNERILGGLSAALFIGTLTFANERQPHWHYLPDILTTEFSQSK
jgi:hypothetical protein